LPVDFGITRRRAAVRVQVCPAMEAVAQTALGALSLARRAHEIVGEKRTVEGP